MNTNCNQDLENQKDGEDDLPVFVNKIALIQYATHLKQPLNNYFTVILVSDIIHK